MVELHLHLQWQLQLHEFPGVFGILFLGTISTLADACLSNDWYGIDSRTELLRQNFFRLTFNCYSMMHDR